MSEGGFEIPGYRLVAGNSFDRGVLLRCLQASHQELRQSQMPGDSSTAGSNHLMEFIERYLSPESPLWWVESLATPEPQALSPLFRAIQNPLGCLWLARSTDQLTGQRHTHILLLYVHPAHRRQGIGSALMQWAFTWARQKGDQQVSLQVFAWNQAALEMYQKFGFETKFLGMTKVLPDAKAD